MRFITMTHLASVTASNRITGLAGRSGKVGFTHYSVLVCFLFFIEKNLQEGIQIRARPLMETLGTTFCLVKKMLLFIH